MSGQGILLVLYCPEDRLKIILLNFAGGISGPGQKMNVINKLIT